MLNGVHPGRLRGPQTPLVDHPVGHRPVALEKGRLRPKTGGHFSGENH